MRSAAALPVLAAALVLSLPASAEHHESRDVTIESGDAKGCAGVHMHFGDRMTARGEETVTLSGRGEGTRSRGLLNGG